MTALNSNDHPGNIIEKRYESLLKATKTGIWECDLDLETVTVNSRWAEIIGYSLEELGPLTIEKWDQLVYPKDLLLFKDQLAQLLAQKRESIDVECRMRHANNHWIWVRYSGDVIAWKENGQALIVYGTLSEISGAKDKEQFKATLLSVGDGVLSTDMKGNIIVMNPIAEKLTGWTLEEAGGRKFNEVFHIVHEFTNARRDDLANEVIRTGESIELPNHYLLVTRDGQRIPIENSAAPIKDQNGKTTGAVIMFSDFTEKKEKQKQTEYMSFTDHLTGLYNRRYLDDAMRRLDTERNYPLSVIILDVNGLKLTNDAFGHEMGDNLLKTVAKILVGACRSDDIICRMGGDEFAVLLPKTNELETVAIIKRIEEIAEQTILGTIVVSVAAGYSVKLFPGQDIQEIAKEADKAMYKNKLMTRKTMRQQTLNRILETLYGNFDFEQTHAQKVSAYCEQIAKAMDLPKHEIEEAKLAGYFHDVGKVALPVALLGKNGGFSSEDWELVKKYPITSYQILKGVDDYASLADYVLYVHECLDGSGYPEGKTASEIPMISKIIAVADAFDAMTSDRPFRSARKTEEAIQELLMGSGKQFDPTIVEVFVKCVS